MGTILKYIFYALIIIAIYFLGVGFYDGSLNKDSSLKEMTEQITSNTKEMIGEGYQKTKDAVQGGMDEAVDKTEETIQNGAEEIETETQEVIQGGFKG